MEGEAVEDVDGGAVDDKEGDGEDGSRRWVSRGG